MQGSQTEEILMSPKPELDRLSVESRGADSPLSADGACATRLRPSERHVPPQPVNEASVKTTTLDATLPRGTPLRRAFF
ncbi:unnamed protein product [Boreogadus saida]